MSTDFRRTYETKTSTLSYSSSEVLVFGSLVHGLISLLNLWYDYPTLSGPKGLIPHDHILHSIQSEYSPIDILAFFPSLLYWLDAMTVLSLGLAAALAGIIQLVGVFLNRNSSIAKSMWISRISCLVVYVSLMSFSHAMGVVLWFPWDCMLFEMLLISMWTDKSTATTARRLLLFRVMFGFGKHKFLGASEWEDLTYTQSMACWQPLGSNIGWYLTFLPSYVHIAAIMGTFFAEIVSPLMILPIFNCSVYWQRVACWAMIALMVSIQLTGHFGWFNTLTSLLAYVVYLDTFPTTSSITSQSDKPTGYWSYLHRSFYWLYLILSMIFLIPSQWNSPAIFYQHSFASPVWDIVRVASSWRILHTYGVFPPKKMPMVKPVGWFEVKLTKTTKSTSRRWIQLNYYYQTSAPVANTGPAAFAVAPWRFPRFDYVYGYYAASHVFSLTTRLGPMLGTGEEYVESVAQMLLQHPERAGQYFQPSTELGQQWEFESVRFVVLGLVPTWEGNLRWREGHNKVDKVWTRKSIKAIVPESASAVADLLPPSMISLRMRSRSFSFSRELARSDLVAGSSSGGQQHSLHRIFDMAVARTAVSLLAVPWQWTSERRWLEAVDLEFRQIQSQLHQNTHSPAVVVSYDCVSGVHTGLWSACHSMAYGGYIGCLTAVHLIPYPLHPPICPGAMIANNKLRLAMPADSIYDKIPIDRFVYFMLGLSQEISTSTNRSVH